MDEPRFWQLIDRAREARGRFAESLGALLVPLEEAALFGFQHELERKLAQSDRAALAGAAYLVLDTCSEQRFAEFRAWLVAQGPGTFARVLADPDSLAELEWERTPELPELLSAARAAWRERTGCDDFLARLPDVEIADVPFGEDEGMCLDGRPNRPLLARRYPRLAAKLERDGARTPSQRLAPRALTDLRSGDAAIRADARARLLRGLDQLCALDVGALVEQACDPAAPERAFLVRLLSELCVPASAHWVLAGFDLDAPLLSGYFDRAPALAERYAAVEQALPALLALLSDPDPLVRGNTAMCVSWFARSATRVRRALALALDRERDPRVVSSLLFALTLQDHYLHEESSAALLVTELSEPPPVCHAACIALYGMGDEPSAAALAGIERLLATDCAPAAGIPWNDGDLASLGVLALRARLPARAPEVERVLFTLLERARAGELVSEAAATQALPALLWLLTSRQDQEPALDPRLGRLLALVGDRPSLASPSLRKTLGALELPGGRAVDAALALAGDLELALELLENAVARDPEGAARRADALAAEVEHATPGGLLVAAAVLAAERAGGEPSPALDALAQGTLSAPALEPFFARFLSRVGEARRDAVLGDLCGRRFVPRWAAEPVSRLDVLLEGLLPLVGHTAREQLLEAAVGVNWRVVLRLSRDYPSRRVVAALLPRIAESLHDLGRWSPESVEQALERDARALCAIGAEAEHAVRQAPEASGGAAQRLLERFHSLRSQRT